MNWLGDHGTPTVVVFQEAPLGVETRRCQRRGNLCRGDDVQGACLLNSGWLGLCYYHLRCWEVTDSWCDLWGLGLGKLKGLHLTMRLSLLQVCCLVKTSGGDNLLSFVCCVYAIVRLVWYYCFSPWGIFGRDLTTSVGKFRARYGINVMRLRLLISDPEPSRPVLFFL